MHPVPEKDRPLANISDSEVSDRILIAELSGAVNRQPHLTYPRFFYQGE